jgi:hypothetical protein
MRGAEWRDLVDRIAALPDTHPDSLAFALMMIKLTGCLNCDLDSYKASLGCCTCAKRAINAFKGSDKVLLGKYADAQKELDQYWEEHEALLGPRETVASR